MHLVPVFSSEQVQSVVLAMQIAWRTEELARLQQQLAPLEQAFGAFERTVAEKTASVVSERNRLREVCMEIEDLTTRIHARLSADPEALLDSLFDPGDIERIGQLFNVDLGEELRATTYDREWRFAEEASRRPHSPRQPRRKSEEPELRSMYLALARVYHPDLAQSEIERAFRLEMMLRINEAWEARDLAAIRALGQDALNAGTRSALSQRLMWQKQELARLVAACEATTRRLVALRSSKTRPLWHDAALTTAAVTRHLQRLRTEIVGLETRRIRARDEFQQALNAYISVRNQHS